MSNRIKVAAVAGALFAVALLMIEQGRAGAGRNAGPQVEYTQASPSPFERHLRYSRI